MKQFLRRLRGIIGTGITWAIPWAIINAVVIAFWGLDLIVSALIGGAIVGFTLGGGFAVVLSIVERHKELKDLSLRRVAAWGGLAGLLPSILVPLLAGVNVSWASVVITVCLAAGSASGTVALARRGDTKLIEGEDQPLPALEGD